MPFCLRPLKSIFLLLGFLFFLTPLAYAQDDVNCCLKGQSFRLVVLGSSTPAGAGASVSDSAWVNRYRLFLQGINPDNEVINLARGGATTYRIMPDGFISPPNRHSVDTLRNISQAIRLGADAVIVNMPSNDAATGVTVAEQMQNFRAVIQEGQQAGIPVWIATTQPRNGLPTMRQTQAIVKDSILAAFSPRAIDLWTGMADSLNGLDSAYDSGDGVHLNDAGHRLVYERVVQANILSEILQVPQGVDLTALRVSWLNPSNCGQVNDSIAVVLANLGGDSLNSQESITLLVNHLGQMPSTLTLVDSIQGLGPCQCDTSFFIVNTAPESNIELLAYTQYAQDINPDNDTSALSFIETDRQPELIVLNQHVCLGDSGTVDVITTDSVFWFLDAGLQTPVAFGNSFPIPSVGGPDTLYAVAVKPPFINLGELRPSPEHNVFWNGTMFNLIAGLDTVYIDSLSFIPSNSGSMTIVSYFKHGSYQGYAQDSSAWSFWGADTISNATALNEMVVHFPPRHIAPFDTLGVYLHMEQENRRLGYQSNSPTQTIVEPGLTFTNGVGVSYKFGNTFNNRVFTGSIFYHFGTAPLGQCQSTVEQIPVIRINHALSPNAPIYHPEWMDLTLSAPSGFSSHLWNTGDTLPVIVISASQFQQGDTLLFWVELIDDFGCTAVDSQLVIIDDGLARPGFSKRNVDVFPNPMQDRFAIKHNLRSTLRGRLYDARGQMIETYVIEKEVAYYQAPLKSGVYFLSLEDDHGFVEVKKLVVVK